MLNITGTTPNHDATFRYKMPALVAKIEGRGNGIKTIVVNLRTIADAICRPPDLLIRFMAIELGAQSKGDIDADRGTLTGSHADSVLQGLVNKFIEMYVLCPRCRLPETILAVRRNKQVVHTCAACGAKECVSGQHKLNTVLFRMREKALAE